MIEDETLKEHIKGFLLSDDTELVLNADGILKPLNSRWFQSWSSSQEVARRFARKFNQPIRAVFQATTSENIFFGKPRELAASVGGIKSEAETISVGPVRFYRIFLNKSEWFNPSKLMF